MNATWKKMSEKPEALKQVLIRGKIMLTERPFFGEPYEHADYTYMVGHTYTGEDGRLCFAGASDDGESVWPASNRYKWEDVEAIMDEWTDLE